MKISNKLLDALKHIGRYVQSFCNAEMKLYM